MTIPKKIWFLWYQGFSEAPLVVKKCYQSWKDLNPDWEVIFLDENNIEDYITPSLPEEKLSQLAKNYQSDILRVELLSEYGGAWVDATTLCRVSLDDWLEDYASSGFFAFIHETRSYGWISNWFLASEKSNLIMVRMKQKLTSFFGKNSFYHSGAVKSKKINFLKKFLNRKFKTTRYWSSWLIVKAFKVYPYFTFHFIFAKLIGTDRECLKIYKKMKKYYTTGDIWGQHGLLKPLEPEIKERIDSRIDPVYKLSWKYNQEQYSSSSILYYLLEGVD